MADPCLQISPWSDHTHIVAVVWVSPAGITLSCGRIDRATGISCVSHDFRRQQLTSSSQPEPTLQQSRASICVTSWCKTLMQQLHLSLWTTWFKVFPVYLIIWCTTLAAWHHWIAIGQVMTGRKCQHLFVALLFASCKMTISWWLCLSASTFVCFVFWWKTAINSNGLAGPNDCKILD